MKSFSPLELSFSFTLVFAAFQTFANFAALLTSLPAAGLILTLFAESTTPLKKSNRIYIFLKRFTQTESVTQDHDQILIGSKKSQRTEENS